MKLSALSLSIALVLACITGDHLRGPAEMVDPPPLAAADARIAREFNARVEAHRVLVSAPAQAPAPAMLVAAWNYTPDAAASGVKGMVRAGVRYQAAAAGTAWDWSRVWVAFTIDGRDCTDAEAAARLKLIPVLDLVSLYHWREFHDHPPADFSQESIEHTRDLIAQVRLRLKAAGLSEYRLDNDLCVVTDFENWGAFNSADKVPGTAFSKSYPHAVTACYLVGQALEACSWNQRGSNGAANYATSHGPDAIAMGGGNQRATPSPVPGSMDGRTTFISGYMQGGPLGCLGEAEVLDALAKAQPPVWLALEDNNPGLIRILRAARASGKVKLVVLWGNGKGDAFTGDTGTNHRDFAAGGSRTWAREQDAAIWGAVR